jgi:CRP/FNR family cyclic AMP-dependent transcriptional regulator
MALMDSNVRSATATAASHCVLVPIDIHSFKSLIQSTPDFALHVMSVLAQRLRHVNEALTGQYSGAGS